MLLTSLLNFLINFLYILISEGDHHEFYPLKILKFSKPIKIILPCRNIRNMLPRFFTVFILLSVFIAVQMLVQVYDTLSRLKSLNQAFFNIKFKLAKIFFRELWKNQKITDFYWFGVWVSSRDSRVPDCTEGNFVTDASKTLRNK